MKRSRETGAGNTGTATVTKEAQASRYARSLIEGILDPLVTISPEGKITDVNEATVKATGVPREKLFETGFSGNARAKRRVNGAVSEEPE